MTSNLLTELGDVVSYLSDHGTPDMGYDQVVQRGIEEIASLTTRLTQDEAKVARLGKINEGLVHDFNTLLIDNSRKGSDSEGLRAALKTVYKLAGGHATECQCRQCEIFEFLEPIVGNASLALSGDSPAAQKAPSKQRVQTADIEACFAWLVQSGNPLAASHQMASMVHELLERRRADETRVSTAAVLKILQSYRCQRWQYDGTDSGMQLTDVLTPSGNATILIGISELESLADYIAGELADRRLLTEETSPRREYHTNGTYWSGVPTVDLPCDFCQRSITDHDPRTHACPPENGLANGTISNKGE